MKHNFLGSFFMQNSLQVFMEGGSSAMAFFQEALHLSTYPQYSHKEKNKVKINLQSLKNFKRTHSMYK